MQKHRKKFKIGLAFLVVVALILFIGDWAFANKTEADKRDELIADNFSYCHGSFMAMSELNKNINPAMAEDFAGLARGAKLAALLLYARVLGPVKTLGDNEHIVKGLAYGSNIRVKSLWENLLMEKAHKKLKEMLDTCTKLTPLQQILINDWRKDNYGRGNL